MWVTTSPKPAARRLRTRRPTGATTTLSRPPATRQTSLEDRLRRLEKMMEELIRWYRAETQTNSMGFFQIGGGIAGDYPICVVPLIRQDLKEECSLWSYFCQISDSTTSYGSYSGAVPNEKISWDKLDVDTPKFMIESDASIVAPLIFSYVLNQ